jgi:tape measure domain-containing protein
MAVKDSVLNFVIKAKNLAGDAISKFRKDVETLDSTTADAGKSVDSLGTAADNLGKEASSASAGTKTLNSALDDVSENANDAASSLKNADNSIDGIAASANQSATAADKAGNAASKLAQRYDAAGKPIETARQELKGTNAELNNVDGASQKAGTSIGSLTKRLLGLAAAAVGINTIKNALRDMLNTGDQFERLSLQMNQTMGSLAEGEQATAWVKDFAKNTPLQLQEVTDTFLRLKNFGLDPQAGAMQAIVDQAAKLGKGYEAVEGISLALGQAWAKQKLQGEEIMQLVERGVPVWDLLAKVTGKNTAELQKMSEAGLLGRDTIKALIDEMGAQSSGAAAQNMSLLSGYISNLTDEWQLFLNEIAQSGALDYAKEQLRQLIQYIQEMKANGELQQWAQRISDGFISVAEASKSVVFAIKDNFSTFALLAKAYAAMKLVEYANDTKNLARSFIELANSKKSATTQTGLLGNAMRALPWVLVIDQVGKAVSAYNQLREAKARLAQSQAIENKVQADATDRIAEFNAQTGLAVKSLDEIIAAQDSGSVAIDEYTGKWRLATDTLTAAEIAQRAQTEAMAAAKAETEAFETQFEGLMGVLAESQKAGKDTADVIAEIGAAALQSGERGVESLSLAIGQLAQGGDEAKAKLKDGLAAFLVSLSEEQYTKFGVGVEEALKRIESGADKTNNRLSFMQVILEAQLAAAAQKAGVELDKVLTGIDADSKMAIGAFEDLAKKVQAVGLEGENASKVLSAGLVNTLKTLDTSEEIEATRASIKAMGEDGRLTSAQLSEAYAQLAQRQKELRAESDAGKESEVNKNKEIADSVDKITQATDGQVAATRLASGAANDLAAAYTGVLGEVEALGPAAVAAFEKLQGIDSGADKITGEFADLKQIIADTSAEIGKLQVYSGGENIIGVNRFLKEIALNAATVKKEYAEQKLAVERLKAAYENGSISAQQFINSARGAASSTSLLNQADLSALKNQIKSAKEQMESFRDSTLGTLNSLQSELANLQGNAERVAQLAFESRITDLNAKLEEAKATGDKEAIANAQQALQVAKDIYNIKKQQIADEKKAQEQAKADAATQQAAETAAAQQQQQQNQTTQTQQSNSQPTGNVQRLEIALPSGKTSSLSGSVDDVNNLLEFLTQAGLRSLQ